MTLGTYPLTCLTVLCVCILPALGLVLTIWRPRR